MVRSCEALFHRVFEAARKRAVFNPVFPNTMFRRLMDESRVHLCDSRAVAVEGAAHRTRHSLLQVIEPLLLLSQSQARMRQLQPLTNSVEAGRNRAKFTLHARGEPLFELVQSLRLLIQFYARVGELQSRARGTEPRAEGAHFTPHTHTQSLERSRESFQASVPVRCYQFRCA